MNRIAGTLAILLALGLVAACGPTEPAASPTQASVPVVETPAVAPASTATAETAPVAGETYTDPAGYSVTLPASWPVKVMPVQVLAGDMAVLSPKAQTMTQFLYQPIDPTLKPEPILTLSTFTAADWAAVVAEGGPPIGTEVGSYGEGTVLVATTPQSNPYEMGTADQVAFDTLFQDLNTATLMARSDQP
jgi:hypothetical protein